MSEAIWVPSNIPQEKDAAYVSIPTDWHRVRPGDVLALLGEDGELYKYVVPTLPPRQTPLKRQAS